jgi:type VI secretion system secreted protein VgrG
VGEGSCGAGGGHGKATAYSEPHMQLSSPAGITATTAADAIFVSGNTGSICAGQDINFASQGNWFATVKGGISLFTYGKASKADKPNQETGIKLHAASGKVSVQAQSDVLKVTADKTITVASVTKSVNIAAKDHVMLTAQGAYLKLEGGNIMIHGPGTMEFKASMKELAGPAQVSPRLPQFPIGEIAPTELIIERFYHDDEALAGAPFIATFTDGTERTGILDGNGRAVLKDVPPGTAGVRFGPMPGSYQRKDLRKTPGYLARPDASAIDALIDKYSVKEN